MDGTVERMLNFQTGSIVAANEDIYFSIIKHPVIYKDYLYIVQGTNSSGHIGIVNDSTGGIAYFHPNQFRRAKAVALKEEV